MEPYYPRGMSVPPYSYTLGSDETGQEPAAGSQMPPAQPYASAEAPFPHPAGFSGLPGNTPQTWPDYGYESVQSYSRPLCPSTLEHVDQTISQQPTPPVQPDNQFAHLRQWLAQENGGRPSNGAPSSLHALQPIRTMPLEPQRMIQTGWEASKSFTPARQVSFAPYGSQEFQSIQPHVPSIIDVPPQMYPFSGPQQQWLTSSSSAYPRDAGSRTTFRPLSERPSTGQARIDKASLRLQPQYVQNGAAARLEQAEVEQTRSEQLQILFNHNTSQQPREMSTRKRKKCPTIDSRLKQTLPPAWRHTLPIESALHLKHGEHSQQPQQLQYDHQNEEYPDFTGHRSHYASQPMHSTLPDHQRMTQEVQYSQPTNQPFQDAESVHKPFRYTPINAPREKTSPEPIMADYDNFPQPITPMYDEYKWSVKLYEVTATAVYNHAQSFLEDVFEKHNLYAPDSLYKWHAHTTKGFIQGGSRLSFVVLHNAANPFERGLAPDSTTSIAVYGRCSNAADKEVHWKTFTPAIGEVLDEYMATRYFCLKGTWRCDMKASERRFHRAYWHAARMLPLRNMLNHAHETEAEYDAVDADEDVAFSDDDLQSAWENGEAEAQQTEASWQAILSKNEEHGEGEWKQEHVVTGCSEWDQFDM